MTAIGPSRARTGTRPLISLLLIVDHDLLLRGLESFIKSDATDMVLIGKATSAAEGCDLVEKLTPDVVLVDLDLKGPEGLDEIARISRCGRSRVLVYTGERDPGVHREAVIVGARGVLVKGCEPEMMLKAIRCIAMGELWLDRLSTGEVLTRLLSTTQAQSRAAENPRIAKLTRREREIVTTICSNPGRPSKRVATALNISENTLRNHLSAIYHKLNVGTRAELRAFAEKAGLVASSA